MGTTLPFSRDAFLDVFAAYNQTFWPVALALWLLTAAAFALHVRRQGSDAVISRLLAVQWFWSALAYHAMFFSSINPAAWAFSALFVIEAAVLMWTGAVRHRLHFSRAPSFRHAMSCGVIGYALAYPLLAFVDVGTFPRVPTFGVPCPTAIATIGFLLAADPPFPRAVAIIPVLWAFIAGSAAFSLGVHVDIVLPIGAVTLLGVLFARSLQRKLAPPVAAFDATVLRAIRRRATEIERVTTMGKWRSVRATQSEAHQTLPGDQLIPEPIASITHAITIRSTRASLWPWLVQMGAGSRAGWYSYDFIDNGRQRSAMRVIADLQQLSVGMVFPALPGMTDGFTVLAFEPERSLILGWVLPDGTRLMTWAFVLEDRGDGSTRLLVRVRGGRQYSFHGLPGWLSKRVVPVIHFVMERKQLLGIASRAEVTHAH